jgi:hypothetical protein
VKLEATEAKLAQTELDLHSEQNVRRTLQSEAAEGKAREDALVQKQVGDIAQTGMTCHLHNLVTPTFCISAHRRRRRRLPGMVP